MSILKRIRLETVGKKANGKGKKNSERVESKPVQYYGKGRVPLTGCCASQNYMRELYNARTERRADRHTCTRSRSTRL